MKVVDFSWVGFDDFLSRSFCDQQKGGGRVLVLGVAEGGLPIADRVADFLTINLGWEVTRAFVTCRRPSTKIKKSSKWRERILRIVFDLLPTTILDQFRVWEHRWLSARCKSDVAREVVFSGAFSELLAEVDWVVVVDDAVDSGASLRAVIESIGEFNENVNKKVVSLAVVLTQNAPFVEPDYVWLRNVLVRFPWSLDAK